MNTPPTRPEDRLARRGGLVEWLRLPAAVFGFGASCRSRLHDRGWLPRGRLGVPVVCVGNLSVGGTGKTPMVVWVTRRLQAAGRRPGLLSRGYGKSGEGKNDEALELERVLPDVPHVQNPDRIEGGRELERLGIDVIVMDDGFQHRRLVRDLDLVLIDATRPWGLCPPPEGGEPVRAFLPRGLLRESPSALARANAIVVTRTDGVPKVSLESLLAEIERLAPGVPTAECVHAPTGVRSLDGDKLALRELKGREVDLFSGIGNPDAFEQTLTALGARVVEHRRFRDHHLYVAGDLDGLGGGRLLLTTAKDAVKCAADVAAGLGVHVLDVELKLTAGAPALDALLNSLPHGLAARQRQALHEGLHG